MTFLTDLADAARSSGLRVIELDGWQSNVSNGAFEPVGVLCHHTGAHDGPDDPMDDLSYARWMAFTGRPPEVPPPLCNLGLSAECVVYVCSSGNANHAGAARASGPVPAASDGSALYVGIEAMNSGSQGWDVVGEDAAGNPLTQREAYARLCAALCRWYRRRFGRGFTAEHVRAHRETSVTGKWDPGLLDMDNHRAEVARLIDNPQEDTVAWDEKLPKVNVPDDKPGDTLEAGQTLAQARGFAAASYAASLRAERAVQALAKALGPEVEAAVTKALEDAVVNVNVTVGGESE